MFEIKPPARPPIAPPRIAANAADAGKGPDIGAEPFRSKDATLAEYLTENATAASLIVDGDPGAPGKWPVFRTSHGLLERPPLAPPGTK